MANNLGDDQDWEPITDNHNDWEPIDISNNPAPPARIPTYLESALSGAVEGIMPGLSATGVGALNAGGQALQNLAQTGSPGTLQDLLDKYRQSRDQTQANVDFKLQSNPMTFRAAEGATSAFGLPFQAGKAVTQGIMKTTPALLEKLGPTSAQTAINIAPWAGTATTGGLIGLGTSKADLTKGEIGKAAEDTGVGAALGTGLEGAMKVAAKSINGSNLDGFAKKMAQVFFNVPPEVTQAYLDDPQRALNSPLRYQISKQFMDMVDNLKKMAQLGSSEARQILAEQNVKVGSDEIRNSLDPLLKGIRDRSEGVLQGPRKTAHNYLDNMVTAFENPVTADQLNPRRVSDIPEPPLPDFLKNLLSEHPEMINTLGEFGAIPMPPLTPKAGPLQYSGNRIKDEVQSLQDMANWKDNYPNMRNPPDNQIMQQGSGILNELLKSKSPEYAEQMKKVAADTELLNNASKLATSEGGLSNMFRRLTTDQYGAGQAPADTVNAFDQRMGTDFGDKAKFAYAREMMDKGITNGSRNVNLFSNMLGGIPVVGKIAGPIAGATIDKAGGAFTFNAVQTVATLKGIKREMMQSGTGQAAQAGIAKIKSVLQPIIDAAKVGNPSAVLTLQLLQKADPESLDVFKSNPTGGQ